MTVNTEFLPFYTEAPHVYVDLYTSIMEVNLHESEDPEMTKSETLDAVKMFGIAKDDLFDLIVRKGKSVPNFRTIFQNLFLSMKEFPETYQSFFWPSWQGALLFSKPRRSAPLFSKSHFTKDTSIASKPLFAPDQPSKARTMLANLSKPSGMLRDCYEFVAPKGVHFSELQKMMISRFEASKADIKEVKARFSPKIRWPMIEADIPASIRLHSLLGQEQSFDLVWTPQMDEMLLTVQIAVGGGGSSEALWKKVEVK